MGFDCKRTGVGHGSLGVEEATLNLIMYLEGSETNPLLKEETLTASAHVELIQQGRVKKLWPIEFGDNYKFMKLEWKHSSKQLEITIGGMEASRVVGDMEMAYERVEQKLTCDTDELTDKRKIDRELYRGELTRGNLIGWIPRGSRSLAFSIGLAKCIEGGDKKTAECDLKLTTGSDLKD